MHPDGFLRTVLLPYWRRWRSWDMWNQMRQMGRASGKGFIQHIHCQGCCSAILSSDRMGHFFYMQGLVRQRHRSQMTLFSFWNELANLLQHLVLKGDRCLYLDCSKTPRCRWFSCPQWPVMKRCSLELSIVGLSRAWRCVWQWPWKKSHHSQGHLEKTRCSECNSSELCLYST